MPKRDELPDYEDYNYARLLLKEKHRDLELLDQKRQRKQVQPDEYNSCHRSLLQAIGELETLLETTPEETIPI
jgi:hemoglobin-like flavoprotein